MNEKEARKILEEYTANITHCGEESFAISVILQRLDELEQKALTFDEIQDIVLDSESLYKDFKPEIEVFKGYILGKCIRKLGEKKNDLISDNG